MIDSTAITERIYTIFEPKLRGVIGIVEDLLEFSITHPVFISYQNGKCFLQLLELDNDTVELPLRKSVFRAILARISALCCEDDSVPSQLETDHEVSQRGLDDDLNTTMAEALRRNIGKGYDLWFLDNAKFTFQDGILTVRARNTYYLEWIQKAFLVAIIESAEEVLGSPFEYRFAVDLQLLQQVRQDEQAQTATGSRRIARIKAPATTDEDAGIPTAKAKSHARRIHNVSPYGGEGEITISKPENSDSPQTLHVKFVNTPSEQTLEIGESQKLAFRMYGVISDQQNTIILANQSTLPAILPHEITSPLPDIGSMLNDFIRIEGVIAHARQSIVYKAFHRKLGMEVAVKMPNLIDAQQIYVLQSFYENEVSILAKLIHNNISRIVYFDQFNGLPYIVTQYVEGKTLTEVMKAHQMQPQVGYCLKVASTTLSALNFAWKRGIIHRDIKPDNLICRPDGQLTVIDWGLAAERDECLPVHSERNMYRYLGCPAFQAPELALPGGRFDSRADIYSLGAMMYLLVTGKYPFNYTKVEQVLYAHQHYEPIPPHELVAQPGMLKLSDLIVQMMAKNPEKRPPIAQILDTIVTIAKNSLGISTSPTVLNDDP